MKTDTSKIHDYILLSRFLYLFCCSSLEGCNCSYWDPDFFSMSTSRYFNKIEVSFIMSFTGGGTASQSPYLCPRCPFQMYHCLFFSQTPCFPYQIQRSFSVLLIYYCIAWSSYRGFLPRALLQHSWVDSVKAMNEPETKLLHSNPSPNLSVC